MHLRAIGDTVYQAKPPFILLGIRVVGLIHSAIL